MRAPIFIAVGLSLACLVTPAHADDPPAPSVLEGHQKREIPEPTPDRTKERTLVRLPRGWNDFGDPTDPLDIQAMLDEVRSHVGTLIIEVNALGAQVTVNGKVVGKSPLTEPVFVEPGEVVVEAMLKGWDPTESKFTIKKGAEVKVKLEIPPRIELVEIESPLAYWMARFKPPPVQDPDPAMVLMGFIGVDVVVGVGVGLVVFGNTDASRAEETQAMIKADGGDCSQPKGYAVWCAEIDNNLASATRLRGAGVGVLIAGGLGAAATTAYALWPRDKKDPKKKAASGLVVMPSVGAGSGGVFVQGAW